MSSGASVPESACCVRPFPDAFGGTGLECSRSVAQQQQDLLCVPLHDCLVVCDHSAPALQYRGQHPVCIDQVLDTLQSRWHLSLPKPLLDYVHSRLDKELRLASLLAWMRLHAAHTHSHWQRWFSSLPDIQDVPLLCTATETELAVLSSHTPALAVRARRAKSQAASSWQSAAAAAPHIWLALPSMEPGVTAPMSYPLEEAADAVGVKTVEGDCPGQSGASKVLQTHAVEMQQLWQWASTMVSSRSFCLIDNEGNKYACLAPLADFANHDAFSSNTAFQLGVARCSCASSEARCPALVLRARASMAQGDEVTINYGADKSNVLLLEAYGFATPANLADRLPWPWMRWGGFADVHADLDKVDGTCMRVLESFGLRLDTPSPGEKLPAALTEDIRARRLLIAAINVSEALAWAADQPTVLQPLPNAAPCADDDTALQLQVKLAHIHAVTEQIDKLRGSAAQSVTGSVSTDPPPPGCRLGLWNAVVDLLANVDHAHKFAAAYRCHILQAHQQR